VRFFSSNNVSHLHVIVDGSITLKWPSSLSTWESFNPEDVKTGIPTTITKQMEAGKLFLHSDLNPIAIAKDQIKGTMVERYLIWLSEEKKKTWTYKNPTTTVPRERAGFGAGDKEIPIISFSAFLIKHLYVFISHHLCSKL